MKAAGVSESDIKGCMVTPAAGAMCCRSGSLPLHESRPRTSSSRDAECMENQPKLPGKTVFLVDVSGSMFGKRVSEKSDLDRFDAAAALAVLGLRAVKKLLSLASRRVWCRYRRRGFGPDRRHQPQPRSQRRVSRARCCHAESV